jgi:hypothetical protein
MKLSDDSKGSTKEVWGVVSSNTTVPPKSIVIARLNLVSEVRSRIQVGQIVPSVLLEGAGATIPGICAGTALSDVYDIGESVVFWLGLRSDFLVVNYILPSCHYSSTLVHCISSLFFPYLFYFAFTFILDFATIK